MVLLTMVYIGVYRAEGVVYRYCGNFTDSASLYTVHSL